MNICFVNVDFVLIFVFVLGGVLLFVLWFWLKIWCGFVFEVLLVNFVVIVVVVMVEVLLV